MHSECGGAAIFFPVKGRAGRRPGREFAQAAVKQFHLEGYVQGNMLREEALAIVAEIEADFMADVLPMDSNQLPQVSYPFGQKILMPPWPLCSGISLFHRTEVTL